MAGLRRVKSHHSINSDGGQSGTTTFKLTSSDELLAEKSSGTVGLSSSEKYNPVSRRRTRLSF